MGLFGRDRRAKPRCLRLTKKLEERQRIAEQLVRELRKAGQVCSPERASTSAFLARVPGR